MSLEIAIQENTAAIRDLIAAMTSNSKPAAAAMVKVEEQKSLFDEPKPEPKAKKQTPNWKKEEVAPAAEAVEAAPVATYQDAAAAITKLSREKGRDVAVALLAKFGANNLKEVKPEQFGEVIAAGTEAMGV